MIAFHFWRRGEVWTSHRHILKDLSCSNFDVIQEKKYIENEVVISNYSRIREFK